MYLTDYSVNFSRVSKVYQACFKSGRTTSALEESTIFTFSYFCISSKIFQIKCCISLNIKIAITMKCFLS